MPRRSLSPSSSSSYFSRSPSPLPRLRRHSDSPSPRRYSDSKSSSESCSESPPRRRDATYPRHRYRYEEARSKIRKCEEPECFQQRNEYRGKRVSAKDRDDDMLDSARGQRRKSCDRERLREQGGQGEKDVGVNEEFSRGRYDNALEIERRPKNDKKRERQRDKDEVYGRGKGGDDYFRRGPEIDEGYRRKRDITEHYRGEKSDDDGSRHRRIEKIDGYKSGRKYEGQWDTDEYGRKRRGRNDGYDGRRRSDDKYGRSRRGGQKSDSRRHDDNRHHPQRGENYDDYERSLRRYPGEALGPDVLAPGSRYDVEKEVMDYSNNKDCVVGNKERHGQWDRNNPGSRRLRGGRGREAGYQANQANQGRVGIEHAMRDMAGHSRYRNENDYEFRRTNASAIRDAPRRNASQDQREDERKRMNSKGPMDLPRGERYQAEGYNGAGRNEPFTSSLPAQGVGNGGPRERPKSRDWLDDTPAEGETRWQKRRRMRESYAGRSNVWDVSPEPPAKLAERFDVGADERKKKERKQKKKEERRARREAKRVKVTAEEEKECGKMVEMADLPTTNDTKNDTYPMEDEDEEEEIIGPALPNTERDVGGKSVDYGKALRPGEGSKMAAFVQDGVRIPRRGEIGLTSDEISAYESQGYVMSGSRNRRMEAVRIRKENQIYSVEELAALNQFSHEERKLREERVMNQFRALVDSKIGDGVETGQAENAGSSGDTTKKVPE